MIAYLLHIIIIGRRTAPGAAAGGLAGPAEDDALPRGGDGCRRRAAGSFGISSLDASLDGTKIVQGWHKLRDLAQHFD